MAGWNWLFGKKTSSHVRVSDRIWLNDPPLFSGLVEEISASLGHPRPLLVTAHFPEHLGELVEQLQNAQLPFMAWRPPKGLDQAVRELRDLPSGCVALAEAGQLPVADGGSPAVHHALLGGMVVIHHHPLAAVDRPVIEFAERIGLSEVLFFTSFDHPLFRRYLGDHVRGLLSALGMKTTEAIEHPVVSRQIEPMQRRVAREVSNPVPADSCEEWFQRNLPSFPV